MMEKYSALRAEILSLGRTYANEPYPPELRERATAATVKMRAAGVTWKAAANALGISCDSARKWWRARTDERALVPVRVVDDRRSGGEKLSLVSPGGFRVVGVDVGDLVSLLRQLG